MEDTEKPVPNWKIIEGEYRAGVKSLRQMGAEHGVSEGAIRKRAKNEEWPRDLSQKIRSKADELVRKEAVRSNFKNGTSCVPDGDGEAKTASRDVPEREIVEANAAVQSTIILAHRRDIQRARALSMKMLAELEAQTDGRDLLAQLRQVLTCSGDDVAKLQAALIHKVTSLGSRSSTMKTLADSLRGLVMLEREAFGLNDKDDDDQDGGIEDVIKRVMAKNEGLN